MRDLRWSKRAWSEWQALQDYIASDNPAAAERVGADILRALELPRRFSESGRPGRVEGTREIVITGTPYLAAYEVHDDVIYVITVQHGAQEWPSRFPKEGGRKPPRKAN
jgi:toxin ParE1/3/4